MAVLQVKRLPDDLYEELKARARAQRVSLTDYVSGVLRRHVEPPALGDWTNALDDLPRRQRGVDIESLLDDVRSPPPDR